MIIPVNTVKKVYERCHSGNHHRDSYYIKCPSSLHVSLIIFIAFKELCKINLLSIVLDLGNICKGFCACY